MRTCYAAVVPGNLPKTMEPSFEKLLVLLARAKIQFVLVGGVAVTLHGYVRLTEDVDILIASSDENIAALLSCLAGYGEGWAKELSPQDFTDEEGAIRIVEVIEQCQIDIFTQMSGLKFDDLQRDAIPFAVAGETIFYASKNALIGLKSQSVREKDQMDARALRQLQQEEG